jgi:hypothetical protein
MASRPPAQLPPEESERRLIQASDRFLRGEISVEEFESEERRYMTDYRSAMVTLAKRRKADGSSKGMKC